MSTFPWTTLITAGAPVIASLGTVWIKGLVDGRAQALQAQQTSAAAALDRQRNAYADLLKTARFWLTAAREIAEELRGLPKDEAIDRSTILVQDLSQAAALVELIGSNEARFAAREIYKASMSIGQMYAQWLGDRAHQDAESLVPVFDSAAAKKKTDALGATIRSFLDTVRPQLGLAEETSAP